ncbi:MAG: PDGLE domain-containing protein [Ornithinibacter sp.]
MSTTAHRSGTRRILVAGLLLTLVLAGVVSFYASGHPDGLEYVAGTLGFEDTATSSAASGSPLAGYGVSSVGDARLSGGLAGVIGVGVVALVMGGVLWLLRRRPTDETH